MQLRSILGDLSKGKTLDLLLIAAQNTALPRDQNFTESGRHAADVDALLRERQIRLRVLEYVDKVLVPEGKPPPPTQALEQICERSLGAYGCIFTEDLADMKDRRLHRRSGPESR